MADQRELLLGLADDELVIGWRDSEWTGIAPLLEEDVAFSSIAQNEIGHARAVYERLLNEPRFRAAVAELWPYALGVVLPEQRAALASRVGLDEVDAVERGSHTDDFAPLWEEMTMVRRSAPAGAQW